MEEKEKPKELKELRCKGINSKNRECNQLLYKYEILKNEIHISIKCSQCNTFTILKLPFR